MVRSCAFGPFTSALAVFGFIRVCSVHYHAHWDSSDSFGYVLVRHRGRRVRSRALGPFSFALWVFNVRSVHFRAPWWTSGSFRCVRSIPVRLGGGRVPSGAFGSLPYTLEFVGVVLVHSVHSRAPGVRSGAFGPFPCSIAVVGFVRVRSLHFRTSKGSFWVYLVHSLAPLGS